MIINFSNLGGGGGGGYVLPVATASRLGGVKIGDGITIDAAGVISVDGADSHVLKSISELPSTAETGDVVAVAVSGESYPNGITFEARTYEGGLQGGRFTFPLDSLSAYTLDNPYILGSVTGYYEGQGLAEVVLYAYNPNDEYLNIIFSPNPDGSDPYDPYTNIYMGPNESGEETAVCGVTFNYVYDDVNMQMVVDIYPEVLEPADEVVFDGIHSGETILGVFQYDGTDWQAVGGDSYTAGQFINISGDTISVTGITPSDYAMATALTEDEQVWASALTDLHTDISAVTAEMASKQAKFTAATDTARDALTGVSEGDVCVVSEFYETIDSDTLYNYSSQGGPTWAIEQTVGHSLDYFAVKPITNPNYDGSYQSSQGMIIQYWYPTGGGSQTFDGIFVDLADGVCTLRYGHNTIDSSYTSWPTASTGNYYAIKDTGTATWSDLNWKYLIPVNSNTMFPVVFEFYVYHPMTTYQYNNGAWIKLATADDVANVRQIAENAQSSANSKLTYGSLWLSSWADTSGFTTGVYDFTINNVNEGTRLHKAFITENEYNNPKIDEIVTSDSFLRVMKMTQDEYDNLQTKDPLVCYIIVENE